jgi:phosphoenolpyruvate-protein phosphotransferase (PTS system enzyme I)
MAPASLPDVRATLAEHTIEQCRELGTAALEAPNAAAARDAVAKTHLTPAGL